MIVKQNSTVAVRLIVLLVSLALLVQVIGCSGKPETTVARFYKALVTKNKNAAKRCCTERFGNSEFEAMWSILEQTPIDLGGYDATRTPLSEIEAGLQSSDYGDTISVWATMTPFLKFQCIKERGTWRIDRYTLDLDLVMDMYGINPY